MRVSDVYKYTSKKIITKTSISYLLIITLIIALAIHGIWQISIVKNKLDDVVNHRTYKIELARDLLSAAYNRHNSLMRQVIVEDAFERDVYAQEYHKWGVPCWQSTSFI